MMAVNRIYKSFEINYPLVETTKHLKMMSKNTVCCHSGLDPESRLFLLLDYYRVCSWIPAYAGMTDGGNDTILKECILCH